MTSGLGHIIGEQPRTVHLQDGHHAFGGQIALRPDAPSRALHQQVELTQTTCLAPVDVVILIDLVRFEPASWAQGHATEGKLADQG